MKKILAILMVGFLAGAGAASAQASVESGSPVQPDGSTQRCATPIDSPEPLTILALATGAAIAGGLSRRRRRT